MKTQVFLALIHWLHSHRPLSWWSAEQLALSLPPPCALAGLHLQASAGEEEEGGS